MGVLVSQISIALSGLVAGMLLWSAIGGVPWMSRLPAGEYVRLHQYWSPRFDPLGPIMVVGVLACDVYLLLVAPTKGARYLLGTLIAALVAVIVISATRNAVLKKRVMRLDPDDLPADWSQRDPRPAFGKWNMVRTVITVLVFLGNVEAMAVYTL
ncbi:anthrone oxygenase family protein [Nonomuraea sp. NPDC050394]|uniref:anthrone oxygenase family protein n=1 Tax=Nonomuraea sp. NPDC050394 TaxID=3364363 RepID=UPI00379E70E9